MFTYFSIYTESSGRTAADHCHMVTLQLSLSAPFHTSWNLGPHQYLFGDISVLNKFNQPSSVAQKKKRKEKKANRKEKEKSKHIIMTPFSVHTESSRRKTNDHGLVVTSQLSLSS